MYYVVKLIHFRENINVTISIWRPCRLHGLYDDVWRCKRGRQLYTFGSLIYAQKSLLCIQPCVSYMYTLTPAGIYVYSRPIYKCGVYILHYRLMLKGIRRKKTIYRVDTRASLISVSSVNSHHLISKYILAECIYIQHRRSENTSSSTIRHWSRHKHSPCHSPLVS